MMNWIRLSLAALLTCANGLLTGKLQSICPNSDGLTGYSFSHRGMWIPGYQLHGRGLTTHQCSAECLSRSDCVAFSGSFKETGGDGACYMYSKTGKGVPSAKDKAYRKCPPDPSKLKTMASAAPIKLMSSTLSETVEEKALMDAAAKMQKELEYVNGNITKMRLRMMKLKNTISAASNKLVAASRYASNASGTAVGNRAGLLAIKRHRDNINASFETLQRNTNRTERLLKDIKARMPKNGTGPDIHALTRNLTSIEKIINPLNDPKLTEHADELVTTYEKFTKDIRKTVDKVVRANIRGLADDMRKKIANLSVVAGYNANADKDPCCPDCDDKV